MAKKQEQQQLPVPDWYLKLEAEYLAALEEQQKAEAKVKQAKDAIMAMMIAEKLTNVKTDLTQAIYTAPSEGYKFNSGDFKTDHPDLFYKYAIKYQKQGYLQMKLK